MENKICTKCKINPRVDYHHCWCRGCVNEYNRERLRNSPILREKNKIRQKNWVVKNRDRYNKRQRLWRKKNPDKVKSAKTKYEGRNPERVKERQGIYRKGRRLKVLTYYSGGTPKCACCGETILEFLCLDHTNGGGNKHRKTLGDPSGTSIYQWIIKNNFPTGFRVLCYNCNNAYGHYGKCPHQKESSQKL